MKFVFESAALCEGLVAPLARCFAAALDELGLEPVVEPEPELAPAAAAERPPLIESGRARELAVQDHHATSSPGSQAASAEGRAPRKSPASAVVESPPLRSVGPSKTARRESGEVARLRLRPREPQRSGVEPIDEREASNGREHHRASFEREASSERESRITRPQVPAPRAVEFDSTVRSSVGESATQSRPTGLDSERVAELLARRIDATPSAAGRLSVQPRASADASDEQPIEIELEPPSREFASPDRRATDSDAEAPAASAGRERGPSGSTSRRVDASGPASVQPPARSHAEGTSTSRELASLQTRSADEPPRAVGSREPDRHRRLRVRPRPQLDAHQLEPGSSPEPIEHASLERRDSIEAPASSMPPRATSSIAGVTDPSRIAGVGPRSASEVADLESGSRSTIRRVDPPSPSSTSTTRLHVGRVPVVARGSEAIALPESELVEAPTPALARPAEAIASASTSTSTSTSTREWPSSLQATHPRMLELGHSPGSARPGAGPAGPLSSVATRPALAIASPSPSGSATPRESSFAPPSAPLVADPIDGELERTLTAVLRNAARRHGIDV
ncbi:MAG TPA: hypothetical protein VK034_09085 [Enhygromyxa sp.]|nr:hypothetical protein [Enhygromyxa sp.]